MAAAPAPAAAASAAAADETSEAKEGEGEEESKGAKPINNGGICDNYRWTQSLQDLLVRAARTARPSRCARLPPGGGWQVTVPVPAGTKAKGESFTADG